MTDYASIHQPVLLEQCVSLVAPALQDPGSIAVDCTLGLAGHTIAFRTASYLSTPHSTRSARCLTTRASIG